MKRILDQELKDNVINAYVIERASLREVAAKYGISYETARNWLKNQLRPRGYKRDSDADPVQEVKAVVKSMGERKLIKLPGEQKYNNNRAWETKEDELLKEALRANFTVKELSEMIGRSITSIYSRKCILINQGYIPKGARFKTPKGLLRKKVVAKKKDPYEVEHHAVLKKYAKLAGANLKKDSKEKPLVEKSTEQTQSVSVTEHKENPVERIISDSHIMKVTLDELASIVVKYDVEVKISITQDGTKITIEK